ncbi:formin-binding protein 1-like [Xenia sp. Carnegie-2017]|uniref:formin-binding protein 1-like n=1 Tax=Xenia sp. Carnegie-2017 TaxID=2897299 RepID=UPI001F04B303|nr:formin-binding protein 1-like [Xenia sp. Carnegie-2017]
MAWGNELWDRSDVVANHTQQSIDFIEKVSKFIKERSRIEQDYAKELKKLCKSYHLKKKEESSLTVHKAFTGILKETEDIAGQHEVISEELQSKVYKELHVLSTEAKHDRKKFIDGEKTLLRNLQQSMNSLDNAKRAYEKSSKESTEAFQNYQKADNDMNMTKMQIEKLKQLSMEKGQQCENAKEAYRDQLTKTNNSQTLHYSTNFPQLSDVLQKSEEDHIARYAILLTQYSDVQAKVIPIINKCLEGMKVAAQIVDGGKDSQSLVDANKTGFSPPGDIPFEEYGKPATQQPGTPSDKKGKSKKAKAKGHKNVKNVGDGNDFQSLNPGEKLRVCKKKIEELSLSSNTLLAERQALEKMLGVYSENTALGDPKSIASQLEDNAKALDKSNEELYKYQCYLAILEKTEQPVKQPTYSGQNVPAPPSHHSSNGEPAPPPANIPDPPPYHGTNEVDHADGEFEDDIRCYVLYDFQGTNEGEITVSAGEELIVLEQDIDSTGWTQVLKGEEEGYVPTAYIQISE